jgi:hypothetical protein
MTAQTATGKIRQMQSFALQYSLEQGWHIFDRCKMLHISRRGNSNLKPKPSKWAANSGVRGRLAITLSIQTQLLNGSVKPSLNLNSRNVFPSIIAAVRLANAGRWADAGDLWSLERASEWRMAFVPINDRVLISDVMFHRE